MKKILIASSVLLPVLAGCGVSTAANQQLLETSCSLALQAQATAQDVQQAVNAVLAGEVDPCAGAVSHLQLARLELERIDQIQAGSARPVLSLVFRVFANEHGDAVDVTRANVARANVNAVGPHLDAVAPHLDAIGPRLNAAGPRLDLSLARTDLK